ncbi:MAG TPA: hypothetical protein VHU84_17630 [Lacipirellulaceae bacterium]|nr:hypothetical protein [Lacipirellulaceae bacterium]
MSTNIQHRPALHPAAQHESHFGPLGAQAIPQQAEQRPQMANPFHGVESVLLSVNKTRAKERHRTLAQPARAA